ncbi:Holliday junction branch migration protein RuvA [Aeromicrobium senzhongii]|uniref:Holliday junction branch migration complex subunit RuvA n=1 Tax=Aeromicrobium senzhongii TaxID=2663859 RepID=A0ABX6SW09_9ACTN|nr:Holliday junction branch migration protein RuvA [Aeromicrobium senzhongii]MTB87339.1 Holliday junction branch migration protein RuvA [Aeromicrobium senzhongii]QNL95599.1 Holliday junction branch migration protein RuvA [Aeromicrobium senzhongii]
MIAHVRGTVATVSLNSAVLDLGGVGYHVMCTPSTIADLRIGQEATLWTSMVVREDSMTLYGFADAQERDMFELVQTASGVGPKVAQAMLAVLPPERLRTAIASSDHATLTKVPGIGRKGAERIVVELKDRVAVASSTSAPAVSGWRDQVHEALVGLGWSAKDADAAIDRVAAGVGDEPDVSTILRDALRSMDRGR